MYTAATTTILLISTCHRLCGGDIGLGEIVNQDRRDTTSDLQDLYRVQGDLLGENERIKEGEGRESIAIASA